MCNPSFEMFPRRSSRYSWSQQVFADGLPCFLLSLRHQLFSYNFSYSKNYSSYAPTKNLKRKRFFDETEEYTESSMQPARRRCKKADDSMTRDDRTVTFDIGESCDWNESKFPEPTARDTSLYTRKKNSDKHLEESTSRRSFEGVSGAKPIRFGVYSVITKILNENRKNFELSAPNCSSNEKEDNSEYTNRKLISRRRIGSPSKSKRLSGDIVRENENSDRYKGTNSLRKGNRKSDSYITLKPLEAYSLGNEEESSETPVNSWTSSKVESPTERFDSSSALKGSRRVSIMESPNERSSGIAVTSSSKKGSISLVITKGHNERNSSHISYSKCHSSSIRRRDDANEISQNSTSKISHSQSKQSHIPAKGEEEDFDEYKGLHSSRKGSITSNYNISSKPGETDFLNLKEESSETPRMSFKRVDSPSNTSGSSEESVSSNWEESSPSREEPGWNGSCAAKTSDEYSSSSDVEKGRNGKNFPEKIFSSHSKKSYSNKLSTKIINYKSRYFSPSNSKGSLSTPRRDRHSPRKYKLPSSTPRKGIKDSYSYHLATPWVADFLSSKESSSGTPRARPKISSTEFSRGPFLNSYQLLGDSLLVRFADQILNNQAVIGENGKYCNGLCVSGQTIDGLIEKVLKCSQPLEHKVIVLIGTNDFLKGSSFMQVKSCMSRLLDVLKERVSEILLLTVPPIPRLKSSTFWEDWEKYNEWIKALDNGTTISVLDIAQIYLKKSREPDLSSYERFMGYGQKRRPDLIHLNREGLKQLHQEILNHTDKLKGC